MPRVSIGVPVFNGERYIAETLDSLLTQTFEDFELIISDNASTDRTEQICRTYASREARIRYIRNAENIGAARNYKRAFDLSSGEYFRWANADDLFAPAGLERCVAVLDQEPSTVLAYPKTKFIDERGDVISEYEDDLHLQSSKASERFFQVMERLGYVNIIYGLMRADALRKTGLLRNFPGGDIPLVAELALYGKFWEIQEFLFFRRLHPGALSSYKVDVNLTQEFFDPSTKGRIPMTQWRHLCAHARSMRRAPLEFGDKIRLFYFLMRMGTWKRNALAREVIEAVRCAIHRLPRISEPGNRTSARPCYAFVLPWDLHLVGGVNQVVMNLYRQMHAAGEFEPLVIVHEWSAFRPIEKVIEGRRTVYLRLWPLWTKEGSIVGLLKCVLASPVWIFDLLRLLGRYRVTAINVHFPGLHIFPIALLRFLRLYRGALILSFHGADLRNARDVGRVEETLWRFVIRSATAIVACSRAFAAEVSDFTGNAVPNVHAIQNGLDLKYFLEHVDRASGLPEVLRNREYIVAVATWELKKGLDILLRAFAEVRRTKAEIALVLIGRAGDEASSLRMLAIELGVEEDVLFIESVPHDRIGMYLEHAKAFCLPSRSEPFGIAILEAGAYRLPVVATRVGGIPEIVVDGKTGILVEAGNAKALAAALRRILIDPDFARALGERLYTRVVDDFSWIRAYQEYRALVPRK